MNLEIGLPSKLCSVILRRSIGGLEKSLPVCVLDFFLIKASEVGQRGRSVTLYRQAAYKKRLWRSFSGLGTTPQFQCFSFPCLIRS